MFQISKQNRANPKYILISSSSNKSIQNLNLNNKTSLYSKLEQASEKNNFNKYQTKRNINRKDTFKSLNKQVSKNIETVRADLNESMNNIIAQQKKNKIFKDLIALLQSQMKKMQQNQKHVNEVQNEQNLKLANKIQYDIQQILQKYNQEVARIHNLKEQVASSRSDRVVFSNLFKKIEKEIKHNEEYYKAMIAKTEINREKRAEKRLKQLELVKQQSLDESEPKEENYRVSVNRTTVKPNSSTENYLFMTNPQTVMASSTIKKPSCRIEAQNEHRLSSNLRFLIEETETKIEKLIKTTECSDFSEAVEYYNSIDDENDRLSDLIAEEDRKIEIAESEIERIRQERRVSEVYETRQIGKLQTLPSTRKIRSIKNIKTAITEQSQKADENLQLISSIFQLLSVPHEKSVGQLISSDQTLIALDNQIDSLFVIKAFKKSDSNFSLSNTADHGLENLLSKMQKFDSCDRILSKTQFCGQYAKQVTKNKRLRSKK